MAEFFAFGGIMFWGLIAVAILPLFFAVEKENPFFAVVWFVIAVLAFQFLTDFKPLTFIKDHPWQFVTYIAVYLGIGVVWGVIKWMSFVYQIRDRYEEKRTQWYKEAGVDPATATPQHKERMLNAVTSRLGVNTIPPRVADRKGSIILWMAYWPISAAWTLLNDPVRRFYNWVYARLAGGLQRISDTAFAKFGIDFER